MSVIKKQDLIQDLLKRVEYADDKFVGYNGDKYIYILDVLTSQTNGNIINRFWILNEINPDEFIRIPDKNGGFTFETVQQDGLALKDINGDVIPVYNEDGTVQTEDVQTTMLDELGEETLVEIQRTKLRLTEFTRNLNSFAPVLSPAIEITIKRFLGEKI